MTEKRLIQAIKICAENHSTTLTLNHLVGRSFVPDAEKLVIHDCVPAVINKLKEADYMLSMSEFGMTVDHLDI